jgi:hypothetical protein
MSLHTLASHLQSAGRGEDKVLVHMTPGEVQGLQSLAMSQGGSLTINPQTGLPEAGILSALLPMVAGFFLGPAGIGLTAMQSAVAVGALGTAATGSLGKGFMMGLGAYGGAGLGAGLTSAGAAAPTTGSGASYGSWAASDAGKLAAEQAATSAKDFAATSAMGPVSPVTNALQPLSPASPFANTAVNASSYTQQFAPTGSMANVVAPTPPVDASSLITKIPEPASVFTGQGPSALESASMRQTALDKATADSIAAQQKAGITSNMPSTMDNLGAGFKKATGSWEGAKQVWDATPKGTGYGLAATGMGVLQSQQEEAAEDARRAADAAAADRRGHVRPYEFSTELTENAFAPRESTSEFAYYTEPRYIAKPIEKVAKEGGLMAYAVGGPVEQMSAENAIGGNMMYPQSQLKTDMYSNPMVQRPMPTNVIRSGIDAPVDAYTGEQRFALGGSATAKATAPTTDTKYAYNPETMQYTQSTTTTPAASNSMQDAFRKFYAPVFGGGNIGIGMGGFNPSGLMAKLNAQAAPQPTTTTETTGGIATPYVQPTGLAAASNMPMVPNIQLQPQRTPEQQLGLESFYPMMEQSLAMRGATMKEQGYAEGGTANGGYSLGSYSDGGRLLRGPGDGVSDSIPASIGSGQPARLADGEFVVPARIVSEIGNGSTEAGARKLYAMMDRVQNARRKTVGKDKVAVNTKADKLLPA